MAVGILASLTAVGVTRINENTQHRKLDSDVQTLNSAIKLYLANGGDLDGISNPDEVLLKLKSSRSKKDKKLHTGAPSGRMIDPRISTRAVEAGSWRARALYNAGAKSFEVVTNQAGIEFILDENLAEVRPNLETRSHGAMKFAENSNWVWNHVSTSNPNAPQGPSTFSTDPNVADSNPSDPVEVPEPPSGGGGAGDDDDDEDSTPAPPRLPRPNFSEPSGAHPEDDFELTVTITNLPPSDDADVMVKIGNGSWEAYSGPIDIPMNTSLRAQFVTKDVARYRDSGTRYAYYYPVPASLSGTVTGEFHSPRGGPNLVYEIQGGGTHFSHGDPVYILDGEPVDSGSPNVLQFDAKNFSNIPPGQKFKLGDFRYHNGNSYYDSHAIKVSLRIVINLPDRGQTVPFDLNLDLVNTENDPDDPAASADYVKIQNLNQNLSLTINDVPYKIALEFGATDSFGFSTKNSFHVYEGASGTGELLGTFLPK